MAEHFERQQVFIVNNVIANGAVPSAKLLIATLSPTPTAEPVMTYH